MFLMALTRAKLPRRPPTIDRHDVARHIGGPIGTQKNDDVCDFLWLAPTAERINRQHRRFGTVSGRPYLIGQGCVDEPRRHGVHSNSLGGKLQRCGLCSDAGRFPGPGWFEPFTR